MNLDNIVPEYKSKNPLVKKLFYDRLECAFSFSQPGANQTILDVGTGNGILLKTLSRPFPDNKYTGIDVLREIDTLSIPNVHFIIDDIRHTSFESRSFDVIYCLDVLEHIEELYMAVYEIERILKKEGLLIVSMPLESWLYKTARFLLKGTFSQERGPCSSPHFWSAKGLMNLLENKFKLQRSKKLFPILPFFQIASYKIS